MIPSSKIDFDLSLTINNAAQDYYKDGFLESIFCDLSSVTIDDPALVDIISEYISSASISYKALAKQRDLSNVKDAKSREQIERALTLFTFVDCYEIINPIFQEIENDQVIIQATLRLIHCGQIQDSHLSFQKAIVERASDTCLFNISKTLHDHKSLYWCVVSGLVNSECKLKFIERSKFLNEISMYLY
ncbi:hypothetical protein [Vibrio sp. D431a]|uniref:hypothetical protein n=1 Tax=Vibrio sp. D431a TaxID=2837388 RepID=UPI002555E4C1|nr:hypothetical protein [Vibrio sp. D431a]MDK9793272.1 hypothetical protein [Vibrio sp. D431a]